MAKKIDEKATKRKEEITGAGSLRDSIINVLQGITSTIMLERIYWFIDRLMSE